MVRLGYRDFSRVALCITNHLSGWYIICLQHDFISGPAILCTSNYTDIIRGQIDNLFTVPMAFFLDKKSQTLACTTAILSDIVFAIGYFVFFFPKESIMLSPAAINKAFLIVIVIIVLHMVVNLYFNAVSNSVYEDVKRTGDMLVRNTEEKEIFFATISHEIRNPLQSLLGSVELLQERSITPVTATSLQEICKNCCQTVLNLVSNILDMSKIAADKMQLSPVASDLREIVNRVVRVMQGRANSKNVAISIQDDIMLPPSIMLDSQRVEQIVLNLVSNAIKFTARGEVVLKLEWKFSEETDNAKELVKNMVAKSNWKEVICFKEGATKNLPLMDKYSEEISATSRRSRIQNEEEKKSNKKKGKAGVAKIEIMDTGIGIDKPKIKELFQPYKQADSSISRQAFLLQLNNRNYGGTGLGLWITKNIITQMEGDISVKSKKGYGSNFIMAFPAKVCKEVTVFSKPFKDEGIYEQFKGKTFLLLDDIPENSFLISEVLKKHGIDSVITQNGNEALYIYKNSAKKIDMIITDLRMPAMSGQTFILEVRKHEKETGKQRMPIIVVTAESSFEERKLCLTKYGANEYLIKPIKYQDLIRAIKEIYALKVKEKVKNILIVDDDVISAKFLAGVLMKARYECMIKNSVTEAKSYFAEYGKNFGVVLLDNLLGDGTGAEFVEFIDKIVTENQAKRPFIVSMSGNAINDQKETYHGLNINGFLQKPIKKQELLDTLQMV
eukprot:TRINITY_DN135016_c0_g1_i1.p1 TRINITY_DN135016_c0_g1~~TRINITY_DN135016_c0_g1_i1.p1  ORF type:complete len:728 (-),score=70.10 TRINITY_DN135016_c0_g1_i1:93-2276(-)